MKRVVTLAAALAVSAPLFAKDVASVNGKPITEAQVNTLVELLKAQGQTDSPQLREQVKNDLILRAIYMQAAEAQGITKDPSVKSEIEFSTQGIIIRSLFAKKMESLKFSDADIQAEYNKAKAAQGDKEYHARHILVDSEETAKTIIARLQKGEDFAALAKEFSTDKGSAENGGDLGWALASSYVPEFAGIITNLDAGQTTKTPVKSQFGWHVVKLEEVRKFEFPKLEEVRAQVEEAMRQQALRAYQEELRSKADVK